MCLQLHKALFLRDGRIDKCDADFNLRTERCVVKENPIILPLILKGKTARHPLVVAGCVPQGTRYLKEIEGFSIVGVQQTDRVVEFEFVKESLKSREVRLLNRKDFASISPYEE